MKENKSSKASGVIIKIVLSQVTNQDILSDGYFTVSEDITHIGPKAFENCIRLIGVIIARNVQGIENDTFLGCTNLQDIIIDSEDQNEIDRISKLLPDNLKNKIKLKRPSGVRIRGGVLEKVTDFDISEDGSFSIPKSVTSIGGFAFSGLDKLKILEIPGNVKKIQPCAIQFCSNLISVIMHEGVRSIEYEAFKFCSNLHQIMIPKSLTEGCGRLFQTCLNKRYIIIASEDPADITRIKALLSADYNERQLVVNDRNAFKPVKAIQQKGLARLSQGLLGENLALPAVLLDMVFNYVEPAVIFEKTPAYQMTVQKVWGLRLPYPLDDKSQIQTYQQQVESLVDTAIEVASHKSSVAPDQKVGFAYSVHSCVPAIAESKEPNKTDQTSCSMM